MNGSIFAHFTHPHTIDAAPSLLLALGEMEWTVELDDLLNQCVFECGYEFTDACRLLQSRARTLRLIPYVVTLSLSLSLSLLQSADAKSLCWLGFHVACSLCPISWLGLQSPREGECALTADLCQVQRMTINPMGEGDDNDNSGDYDDHHHHHGTPSYYESELHLHQQVLEMEFLREAAAIASSSSSSSSGQSSPLQHEPAGDLAEDQGERAQFADLEEDPCRLAQVDAPTGASASSPTSPSSSSQRSNPSYPMYECAPLLELSISEAELDLLISSLPDTQPEDDDIGDDGDGNRSADAKSAGRQPGGSPSEMQWVLSFLTDPNDAAQHDAEAKSLLENLEKYDDDNYQYFLQELNQANLLLAGNTPSSSTSSTDLEGNSNNSLHAARQESSNDPNSLELDAAQALARLKVRAKAQEECRQVEIIDASHSTDDPIGEDDDDSDDESEAEDDDEDWEIVRRSMKTQATRQVISSNGTHIVSSASSSSLTKVSIQESRVTNSRFMPPAAPSSLSQGAGSENSNNANSCDHHSQKNHRVALSQEIGNLLKTHGEFQFPRHMFPHHNDEALAMEK